MFIVSLFYSVIIQRNYPYPNTLCLIALPIVAICKWVSICFLTCTTQRVYASNFGQLRSFLTKHNIGYKVIALYVVSFTVLASIFVTIIHRAFFFGGFTK